MSSSPPPATAVSTPTRNGRDYADGEREKTPTMSSDPAPTNGNLNGDSGAPQHADDNPPPPSSEHSVDGSVQRGEKQIKVLVSLCYLGSLSG